MAHETTPLARSDEGLLRDAHALCVRSVRGKSARGGCYDARTGHADGEQAEWGVVSAGRVGDI